ncbi:alpha/beta hydrolase [Mycetocola tolaasinivorans]|uniref:Alpha/beta hydrolase n=1 Tax=Mycetocola tolaasinivorans TaxID=76635 RepID=A0A3L7ABA4_9MICO|nr:alpha/beta hydrolase [Mycetocola tolaasinivorans]RLP77275.1 alpha/beta hydrolase [Mycetocola tolaasinivorans]
MIARVHGTGTPLIMIHGFGVDHRILLPLEEMVGNLGWQRIYLDLPWAEGAEDSGVGSPRELAASVLTEVSDLIGQQPFAVLGNSFGALIARHLAHALPERCLGLATLAGAFRMNHAERTLPAHRVVTHDADVLERAGDARGEFESMAVIHTFETLDAFERFVLPGVRGANAVVLDRLTETYTDAPDPELSQPSFAAPSLHLFGRQDQIVGFEDGLALRGHYPRGSFVVLDGAGHNLHIERPAVVGPLVRDWLDRAAAHGLPESEA